jgi:molecular chaperone DnaK (HSP70)
MREKIDAKNNLESQLYQIKNAMNGSDCKMSDDDKKIVNDKICEIEEWSFNSSYQKSDYEAKQKELQDLFTKMMTSSGAATADSSKIPVPEQDNFDPKIEEID